MSKRSLRGRQRSPSTAARASSRWPAASEMTASREEVARHREVADSAAAGSVSLDSSIARAASLLQARPIRESPRASFECPRRSTTSAAPRDRIVLAHSARSLQSVSRFARHRTASPVDSICASQPFSSPSSPVERQALAHRALCPARTRRRSCETACRADERSASGAPAVSRRVARCSSLERSAPLATGARVPRRVPRGRPQDATRARVTCHGSAYVERGPEICVVVSADPRPILRRVMRFRL